MTRGRWSLLPLKGFLGFFGILHFQVPTPLEVAKGVNELNAESSFGTITGRYRFPAATVLTSPWCTFTVSGQMQSTVRQTYHQEKAK